jgi:hypothetical protein
MKKKITAFLKSLRTHTKPLATDGKDFGQSSDWLRILLVAAMVLCVLIGVSVYLFVSFQNEGEATTPFVVANDDGVSKERIERILDVYEVRTREFEQIQNKYYDVRDLGRVNETPPQESQGGTTTATSTSDE